MQTGEISRRIHECMGDRSRNLHVKEVRIGLGYVGVMLEGDRLGLSAVLRDQLLPGCSTLGKAGTLAGSDALELLDLLVTGENPLETALGLATANALLCPDAVGDEEQDSIAVMGLSSGDRVAMVGYFAPLVARIEKTGARLRIIEKDPNRMKVPDCKDRDSILAECSVAIITATSILNNTIEEILNGLDNPRHVTILGPSTPLCEEAFAQTPVTHLGGSAIRDHRRVMQIISEGGGTPSMRPYLRFIDRTIKRNADR